MKRIVSAIVCLVLLFSLSSAFAEDVFAQEYRVYNCESYITLRDEPSTKADAILRIPLGAVVVAFEEAENGFLYVHYENETGYALKKYLLQLPEPVASPVTLKKSEIYNINLFLTNFTESFLCYPTRGVFDIQAVPENVLVDFALEHTWFNYNDTRIEWGEFKNGNNVRMKDTEVRNIIRKYFGVTVSSLEPIYADYTAPYYYWEETGGHTPGGFALSEKVEYIGANRYLVPFTVYASGDMWDNDDLSLSHAEAARKFPYSGEMRGLAMIYAKNIHDRSTYKLIRLIME